MTKVREIAYSGSNYSSMDNSGSSGNNDSSGSTDTSDDGDDNNKGCNNDDEVFWLFSRFASSFSFSLDELDSEDENEDNRASFASLDLSLSLDEDALTALFPLL